MSVHNSLCCANILKLIAIIINDYQLVEMIAHDYYRIYSCIMRTFFAQMLPLKSRCALCTDPFVFIRSSLHNNTNNAKSNNSQFYKAWSLNQEKVFAKLPTSLQLTFISHSVRVSQVYDHDRKYVVFSRNFR